MTMIELEDADAAGIEAAVRTERRKLGNMIPGMALTLAIVTDEEHQAEATSAATRAMAGHPCRILTVVSRPGRGAPCLDARIMIGDVIAPAEAMILRLVGPLAGHPESVVLPLLLPDAPVVAWWPADAPDSPADDPVGRMADRRITDSWCCHRPHQALLQRARTYQPGDTDLAWTHVTEWRAVLAACLDEPTGEINSAAVSAQASSATGAILAAWLKSRLRCPVSLRRSRGPGITRATIETSAGDIVLTRPDGAVATLRRPGKHAQTMPLRIRRLRDVLREEINRLGPDTVYAAALACLEDVLESSPGGQE